MPFVSRGGEKLEHALNAFHIHIRGRVAADFGSSTGGFVDCLLQHGATKVFAVETGYGVLDWKLRNDPRVIVMERTNAMHVSLPETVDIITMDTSWTKLEKVLPNVVKNLKPDGEIVSLLKPHYEAHPRQLRKGKLAAEFVDEVVAETIAKVEEAGLRVAQVIESPITGEKGGNREFLLHLLPKSEK